MKYSLYNDQIKKEIHEKYNLIAGIDEVGRGPLAGPVVTCAVIMKKDSHIEGVTDSKKLSRKKMLVLKEKILAEAIAVSYGFANARKIDQVNIRQATLGAMKDALDHLEVRPDIVLIDAERIDTDLPQLNIVKGDLNDNCLS